jgi:peptide/nickel transport system ATP-binding protein
MNNQPVLEIKGLNVDYGLGDQAVRAVRDVTLTLHCGEMLGLAGESGSGKSTLAYGATRLLPPPGVISGGAVIFHPSRGEPIDIMAASPAELRRLRWAEISIVFQAAMSSLSPVHKISTQLVDAIEAHGPRMSGAARAGRARQLLELVGISPDHLDCYPHELSGGMRQRVMIGMALALQPRIVIMDEPTTAIDTVMQRQILGQLIELRQRLGFAVLFITHDLSLLVESCDRIAIMYGGRIVEEAPAAELYRHPHHPYSDGLLRSFPVLRGPRIELTGVAGAPPDLRAMPTGCAFHPRCPHAFDPCATKTPELGVPAGYRGPRRTVACWLHPPRHTDEETTWTPPPPRSSAPTPSTLYPPRSRGA